MKVPDPILVKLCEDRESTIATLPDSAAVFLLWPAHGEPYMARTNRLRRRVARLMRRQASPSASLSLEGIAQRLEYWPVRSSLGGTLLHFAVARQHFPSSYAKLLKLRSPHYVRLITDNQFPRLHVTTRFGGGPGAYVGPFSSRAAAELFEAVCLDQFLLRRCVENLNPSPEHPGCVYGEMQRCLRPCQQAATPREYQVEALRVQDYLSSGGTSLVVELEKERDTASAELDFEKAARTHHRIEKARLALPANDLPKLIDRLHGICVIPTQTGESVELWPVVAGCWQDSLVLSTEYTGGQARSLDARLREILEKRHLRIENLRDRAEGLAILSRWFYSSWREGEWLVVEEWERLPYRKLVNAIGRVTRKPSTPSSVAAE